MITRDVRDVLVKLVKMDAFVQWAKVMYGAMQSGQTDGIVP